MPFFPMIVLVSVLVVGVALGGFFLARQWGVHRGDVLGLAVVLELAGGFLWTKAVGGLAVAALVVMVAGVAVAVGAVAPGRRSDVLQR